MNLHDPRAALAEQSSFVGYLMGLAGVSRAVHALAGDGAGHAPHRHADDFVAALLGLASLGAAIESLAGLGADQHSPPAPQDPSTGWLR